MEHALQPDVIIYYIDNETGQIYAEIGGKMFEMEIGDDITEELGLKVSDLEVLRVFDPSDGERYEGLRIDGPEEEL